jgi:hypothetical protein
MEWLVQAKLLHVKQPLKRYRRMCILCTVTKRKTEGGKTVLTHTSIYENLKPRRTQVYCSCCYVPLCDECYDKFHLLRDLPCPEDYHAPHDDDDDGDHHHVDDDDDDVNDGI